ncbi:DtxR family iron (metal) dependent repressor [Frondihabitans sp. PhB188]|uniref:metal-dependent transcriptional regulator n=1 Tax=Frondihabitans sp. PhB188 TaxID=2485200 RepID=UPI000F46901B|nr:metal-dependent transcriptional regulator [Frondihabitans sp. PhB188]ROQ39556.1 DtxR family iron (metal) dependent repressor [Frondihabitans sp. PhB188]
MPEERLGTMTEDYVKVIFKSHEWSNEGLTTNDLAAVLGVAPSSVSGNLKKLAREGFLDYEPYGRATLTRSGRQLAVQVVRRHRLIETYLVEHFGYGWDEVHDEAEVLEHAISDRLLAKIDAELGFPDHDPHGDPIPAADGTVTHPEGIRLQELPDGSEGTVVRVSDHDPALLRYLDTLAVAVGTRVRVVERHDFAGSLAVAVGDGNAVELANVAAGAIWVAV